VHNGTAKSQIGSKRVRAFISDLRKSGVSKRRSERVATKILSLAEPERLGTLVKKSGTQKKMKVYALDRSTRNGQILVYKSAAGPALVVYAPSKARRRTTVRK